MTRFALKVPATAVFILCVYSFLLYIFGWLEKHPYPLVMDITSIESGNRSDSYWKINQVFVEGVEIDESINIRLSNSIPNFKSYAVKTDRNEAWTELPGSVLSLPLSRKPLVFFVRGKNMLDGRTADFRYVITVQDGRGVVSQRTSPLPLQDIPFRFERYDAPEMNILRKETLDITGEGKTQWEKYQALQAWVGTLIPAVETDHDSNWNAVEILRDLRENSGGALLCDEYAAVFVSACNSVGLNARMVHLMNAQRQGHYAAEVWSDHYQKWIFMDPLYNFDYCVADDCFSTLDLHNLYIRQQNSNKPLQRAATITDHYLNYFHSFQIILSNDFFSNPQNSLLDLLTLKIRTLRWVDEHTPPLNRWKATGELLVYYYVPKIGKRVVKPAFAAALFLVVVLCMYAQDKRREKNPHQPLRVLMIISFFYPARGGAERQALVLSERLTQKGINMSVLTRKVNGLPAYEMIGDIPVYRSIRTLPAGKWFTVAYTASVFWFLFRHRYAYDIIHCHILQGFHSVVALIFKLFFNKKVLIKVAASGPLSDFTMLKNVMFGNIFLKFLRYTDRVVTVCSQSKREALAEGFPASSVISIPNGVDITAFYPGSSGRGPAAKIAFVGRLDHMKGVHVLIRAMKRLHDEGLAGQLQIIGDGPDRRMLMKTAEDLGVEGAVSFCGETDDVIGYLRSSVMFVLPSLSEGLSNVILEAMACGLPVVATRAGGTPDLIRDGVNGILVDPDNSDQLSHAMRKVLTDNGLAEQLGRQARKTVEEKFSIDHVADEYVRLYQELLVSDN